MPSGSSRLLRRARRAPWKTSAFVSPSLDFLRWVFLVESGSSGGQPPRAELIDVDGDQDDEAEDHVLPLLADRNDLQPVVDHRDDQGAYHGADDRALAARER